MRVAILGGGLTGLTIGYSLKQQGVDFEILEKESSCGGLMRTLQEDGFTFDCGGSHILYSRDERASQFMLNLLSDNKIKNKSNVKILYENACHTFPFESGLADLSKQDAFECLHDYIQSLIKRAREPTYIPENFKQWCYHTFGKGIAEKYLIPYNEKIWKFPPNKMSTEWVQRIPNPSPRDIIKGSLGFTIKDKKHPAFFYYPRVGGISTLIETLENGIHNNIIRSFNVDTIRKEHGRWIISSGSRKRSYDKIVSTIPLPDLVRVLELNGSIANAATNLKYNSLITVMFGLNAPKPNGLSWLYIPDENTFAHRISFPSNYSPRAAPEGKSSIMAEITCNLGDVLWTMNDADIVEQVTTQLHKGKMLNKKDICYSKVKRSQYAYVIYDLKHQKNVGLIRERLKSIGVDVVGRFAEFEYLNMDDCVRHAIGFVNGFQKRE